MANFNFNPSFPGGIKTTLDLRKADVKGRAVKWNYQKIAYFKMENQPTQTYSDATPGSTSIFDVVTDASTPFPIGAAPTGGHLSLYTNEGGIRRFLPKITSAKISLDGGGDIYNSFIREVEVDFQVFTLDDLNTVVKNYFRIGGKVKIEYGWVGSTREGESGDDIMTVYNFGYSMSPDGAFNCNLKGLTGDAYAGSATVGGTIELKGEEVNALGAQGSNPADISMALLAKYKTAFGLDADENASEASITNGELLEAKDSTGNYDLYMAGIMNAGESESNWPFMGDDPVRTAFVRFESLIDLANKCSGGTTNPSFIFGSDELIKIPNKDATIFGSADPRKFILPGAMSDYGEENSYKDVMGSKELNIKNILVSIDLVVTIVKNKGTTVKEKFRPPQMTTLISEIGTNLKKLTGGLVDLKVVPATEDASSENTSKQYEIINYLNVIKEPKDTSPYTFTVLGEDSIVKDVSVDTEFDIDVMTMLTVGNVRNGSSTLAPFQSSGMYSFPTIEVKDSETGAVVQPEDALPEPAKMGIGKDGVDDSRANAIATKMMQALVANPTEGSYASFPFQIKLGVKLDGISGIPFLSPITIDRLPVSYENDKIKFLVMGVEQTFDGDGGWETDIRTSMTIGK